MNTGYIYIVHTREFINLNKNIYKIGRTKNILNRIKNYPKGSEYLFVTTSFDEIAREKEIINCFKLNFIQKKEFGTEYFEGDIYKMIFLIKKIIFDHDDIINTESNSNTDTDNNINTKNIINKNKYQCDKCQKSFKQKGHLDNHLNKKNSCIKKNLDDNDLNIELKKINEISSDILKKYLDNLTCVYCKKKFSRKDTVVNHVESRCKKKKELENKYDKKNRIIRKRE